MAKWIYTFVFIVVLMEMFFLISPAFAGTKVSGKVVYRKKRFLFGWGGSGPRCGGPGDCPSHHCGRDEAVINGYCCGCGRYSDRVPVRCSGNIRCPLNPEPLCSDYDYMMDCCC